MAVHFIEMSSPCSQTPLQEQEGPSTGTVGTFELMSSKDLAYQMTIYEWELFNCVHEVIRIYVRNTFQPLLLSIFLRERYKKSKYLQYFLSKLKLPLLLFRVWTTLAHKIVFFDIFIKCGHMNIFVIFK